MTCPSPKDDADFALDLIRLVGRRLREIDQVVITVGTALSQGRCPPRAALKMVDQVAPGCIDEVYLSMFEGVSPEQLRDNLGRSA